MYVCALWFVEPLRDIINWVYLVLNDRQRFFSFSHEIPSLETKLNFSIEHKETTCAVMSSLTPLANSPVFCRFTASVKGEDDLVCCVRGMGA